MSDAASLSATGSAYDRPEASFDADLVQVGRGTPMGELLRRYWHPVYKSDKLTDLPVQVRALSEDIILFRKPTGEVGAVYPRCVHRGTSLLYGKVTDNGIRCCYHGWTFETDGKCTDQPAEPDGGGPRRNAIRQPWYPVEERYGLIFVYMGPLARKPPLPRYDLLENIPEGWEIYADDTNLPSGGAEYMPVNWLQNHENGLDPAHVPIVHEHQFPPILAKTKMETFFETGEDRIRSGGLMSLGPMKMDFRVELLLPTVRIIPDPLLPTPRPDGKSDNVAWTLPKDDTDTIVFTASVKPVGEEPLINDAIYNGKKWKDLSFEEHQRFPGDFEAQVGQGPITLHSEEHLVSSDKGVVLLRRLLRSAVRDVAEGRDPPLAFGPSEIYIETTSAAKTMPNPDYVPEEEAPADEPSAVSSPSSKIIGNWALTLKTPMGEQKATVILSDANGTLSGVMTGSEGEVILHDVTADGTTVRWKAAVKKPMAMTLKFDVKIDGDKLSGTFKPGMFPSGPVTGVRA